MTYDECTMMLVEHAKVLFGWVLRCENLLWAMRKTIYELCVVEKL